MGPGGSIETTVDKNAETERIWAFVDGGNFHAAYNIALSAMNACRRHQDQPGVDHFIGVIREVVEALDAEFGAPSD